MSDHSRHLGHRPLAAAEFEALLDHYGADRSRWPAEQRNAVEKLLSSDDEARAALAAAVRLDAALDALLRAPSRPLGLRERIVTRTPPRDACLDWLASRLWRPVGLASVPLLLGFAVGAAAVQETDPDAALEDRALVAFEEDFGDYELPDGGSASHGVERGQQEEAS